MHWGVSSRPLAGTRVDDEPCRTVYGERQVKGRPSGVLSLLRVNGEQPWIDAPGFRCRTTGGVCWKVQIRGRYGKAVCRTERSMMKEDVY